MGSRLLVVEDDPIISRGLRQALTSEGYDVTWCETGDAALRAGAEQHHDLVLLDLGLPDLDGLEVCAELRRLDPSTTIVILTARTAEIDVVIGLDAGADDYLTKPFRLGELAARLRAHLRRAAVDANDAPVLTVGPTTLDRAARRVWHEDREIELRSKEFDLLSLLVSEAGRVVTRETIMRKVWDEHWFGPTKTLDMHISALRRKLDDPPEEARLIVTLRGVGYRFELP